MAEVSLNNLAAIGITLKLQPIERAGFYAGYSAKKYPRGVIQAGSGAFGNAATRLAAFVVNDGAFVYGSYPSIHATYAAQVHALGPQQHACTLARLEQL